MDLGIIYHIENAPQFWAELEEILEVDSKAHLSRIDNALKTFVSFCTQYHELYLQTSLQLEHACSLLLESDIFSWHSERLSEILLSTAANDTNPHCELIVHSTLLIYGRKNPAFLRSRQKWKPIFPILMDHVMVEMDDDFGGNVDLGRGPAFASGVGVPIEARLRSLAIGILYEACRVQKFDAHDLLMFNDTFIERLFDLVELTRNVDDESLNYSVIKLIVALNEQYMVAAMPTEAVAPDSGKRKKERKQGSNKILDILLRRVHSSKTFGENLIFMLNRANDTEEDLVMQLLLLKILYLLFTTPGTQNYFYTNDLRVLVDVFLRELVDLPEESEALRHTYLRVLNPLLNNTQLKEMPYKGPLIRRTLQGLISPNNIREVTPTTRRLVERCLNADWCRALPVETEAVLPSSAKSSLPSHINVVSMSFTSTHSHSSVHIPSTSLSDDFILEPPKPAFRFKTLQKSVSAEGLVPTPAGAEAVNGGSLSLNNGSRPPPSRQASAVIKPSPLGEARKPSIDGVGANGAQTPTLISSSGDEAEPPATVHQKVPSYHGTKASASSAHNNRRPSLGNADISRTRKPPPPVPTLDRASLDSKRPSRVAGPPPVVHRREPPAIPSKSKKPKSQGTISDSPLSKIAYSATTAAR